MQLGSLKELKSLQVAVGSVFRMVFYPKDGVRPKSDKHANRTKYFVIVGIDESGNYIGALLINTDVNINKASIIARYQHCIYPERYCFLNNQYRYIDCYKLFEIDKSRISEEADYIGIIESDDLSKVRTLLTSSPVMDQATLQRYRL